MKLKVENTIRWREIFDKDGNVLKESNARVIKWSDGSMSLHLGSEIFDVYKQPLVVSYFLYYFMFNKVLNEELIISKYRVLEAFFSHCYSGSNLIH